MFPKRWKDLTLYKPLILRIYCHFSGQVWLAFDRAFPEHAAATGLFDLSLMNVQPFNFHAAGASLHSSSPSSGQFLEPFSSSSSQIACISWKRAAAPPLLCVATTTTVAAGVADRIMLFHALCDRSREWTIIASIVAGPWWLFPPPSSTWGATNWFRH